MYNLLYNILYNINHYNGNNSFIFANAIKIYQFKAKGSEIKTCILCIGNISKYFTIDNVKKT